MEDKGKDLANIVRRRHKVVKDLLENSTSTEEINHPCLKEGVTVEHYSSSAGQDKKVKHVTDLNGDVAMTVPHGDSATFDETDEAADQYKMIKAMCKLSCSLCNFIPIAAHSK